jgi:acetolactate synthase I/II/III large subunit
LRLATAECQQRWIARRRAAEAEIAQQRDEANRKAASNRPTDAPDAMLAALGRALPERAVVVETVTNRPAVAR